MQSSDLSPIDFHANLHNSDVNLQNVNGLDLAALIESNEEITKKVLISENLRSWNIMS